MRIRLSTLRQLIREAVDEATCGCGGTNQGMGCECGTYEIAETDKDKDGDGDKDFADVMIARRVASGESKKDAIKATRKHNDKNGKPKNESVTRFIPWR